MASARSPKSAMNDRERFLAVARFEEPDYVPIFAMPGAPGMAGGCMKWTHRHLVETGMPGHVGGSYEDWVCRDIESWYRYWGTTGPLHLDFGLGRGAIGIKSSTRIEDGFEVIEYETGALTRQVIDNANVYSMPEFVRHPVRDMASWRFWAGRMKPAGRMPPAEMEEHCRRFDGRTRPLFIGVWGAYGFIRSQMGPEGIGLALYDQPELVREMIEWMTDHVSRYVLPLIERLRPEAVYLGEDLCYNHGMLLSPAQFREFCGPYYKLVCDCCRASGVAMITPDSDGNVMEFVDVASAYGVNGLYPFEVKAGNDLFALRRRHPRLIVTGWLEKEIINEGNEHLIEPELMRKVPPLLAQRGYFPNGDHGIQPLATFEGLRRFMALLHELCGNPEGEFPRT